MAERISRVQIGSLAGLISFFLLLAVSLFAWGGSTPEPLKTESLEPIAGIIEQAILEGKTPGAVVLIGQGRTVAYHKAFGLKALAPEKEPMPEDAIFDLASLTKVVATTTAVMQLIEQGKIRPDKPVSVYWPQFRKNGKASITVRQLLTHYSGLEADLDIRSQGKGYAAALKKILAEKPVSPPGSHYLYSDVNFIVLGELVSRVSGLRLDKYCRKNIFEPLGMIDTGFKPRASLQNQIVPTIYRHGKLMCGEVHDPSCFRMGGIAGHAGLFSTARDLSRFAMMLLNGGALDGKRILKPTTVHCMTTQQSPLGKEHLRGFGWDLYPSFIDGSCPDAAKAEPAYGHLGYTGTALWIDPGSQVYIILLTNRVQARNGGDVSGIRRAVKGIVIDALNEQPEAGVGQVDESGDDEEKGDSSSSEEDEELSEPDQAVRSEAGIDVLKKDGFKALAGMRIGLITNQTGTDSEGRRTIDLLFKAPGIHLKVLFSPEHGLEGKLDSTVPFCRDAATGLPVYSLYGTARRPTSAMLKGLDALVYDIQDVGVRFYTYIATMGYAMEAAAGHGLPFYVLDRPDPITAEAVQGPMSDPELKSFTSYFPLPIRYGMTAGELAQLFNAECRIGTRLNVIPMRGYKRAQWYDETGAAWRNPSPNLRNLTEAVLYPGVALVEGANVSVGRGTKEPFEVLGAPWIDSGNLVRCLEKRNLAGVKITEVDFVPSSAPYRGRICRGIRIGITDRNLLDSPRLGIEIIAALHRLYPGKFQVGDTLGMIGSQRVMTALLADLDPKEIAESWKPDLEAFDKVRQRYLLY